MSGNRSPTSALLGLLLLIVLSPLIVAALLLWVAALLLWLVARVNLYMLVWLLWCTRGKDVLFVYSDSPIWHDHIEEHIIPRIEARSIILNWSDRRHWLHGLTLSSFVFRHFGGTREFNPLAVYFRPFRRHRTFRFWQPFQDWKHGKPAGLNQLENDFFRCIG